MSVTVADKPGRRESVQWTGDNQAEIEAVYAGWDMQLQQPFLSGWTFTGLDGAPVPVATPDGAALDKLGHGQWQRADVPWVLDADGTLSHPAWPNPVIPRGAWVVSNVYWGDFPGWNATGVQVVSADEYAARFSTL